MMRSRVRKFALTAHVTSSVGFLGAVAAFLALAIAGLTSGATQTVRAAYVAMELTAWYVVLPFSFASLFTGIVQALGTPWGLFRHYWVVVKLLVTMLSTAVLLLHMKPIAQLAALAAGAQWAVSDLRGIRIQLVANAATALAVLLVATTLSVYKPQGMTAYGWRKTHEHRGPLDAVGPRVRD
jgi:hypothetical protein